MATINWISPTAANWNTPSAWSSGVVPGSGDTAVLGSAGAGNCTLDVEPTIQGFKLLADYAGVFNQNNKAMAVGTDGIGAFHVLKSESTFNAAIDFYGNDMFLADVMRGHVRFRTSCDFRKTGWQTSGGSLQDHTIDSGVTMTFQASRHPDYPGIANGTVFRQNSGIGSNHGILDVSQCTDVYIFYGSSVPSYNFANGLLRNTSENIVTVTWGVSAIAVGRIEGGFDSIATIYSNNTTSLQGDFSQFRNATFLIRNIVSTSHPVRVDVSNASFGDFDFTSNLDGVLTFDATVPLSVSGNVSVVQGSTGTISFADGVAFFLSGTADQHIDLSNASNATKPGLILQKLAGTVSNAASSSVEIVDISVAHDMLNSGTVRVKEAVTIQTRYTANSASRLEGNGTIRTDRSPIRALA